MRRVKLPGWALVLGLLEETGCWMEPKMVAERLSDQLDLNAVYSLLSLLLAEGLVVKRRHPAYQGSMSQYAIATAGREVMFNIFVTHSAWLARVSARMQEEARVRQAAEAQRAGAHQEGPAQPTDH